MRGLDGRAAHGTQFAAGELSSGVSAQLTAVVGAVRPFALGAYLYGSAATGGLRPGSDLDFLVITERRLERAERRELVERLLPIGHRPREVEVTVLAREPFRHPLHIELQYGEWWRAELERGEEPWPDVDPDATILLATALRSSQTLLGSPLAELAGPVPDDDLRRALRDDVPILLPGLETDTRYSVLTLTRIWHTLETGEIGSKDAAADWVLERVPPEHRGLLEAARDAYLHGARDDWSTRVVAAKAYADYLVPLLEA